MPPKAKNTPNTKVLGDAAEHYSISQFAFAGLPGTKMPDNWERYDLAVETGTGLKRISVKLRTESDGWEAARWLMFDDRKECDWIVFIFKQEDGGAAELDHSLRCCYGQRQCPRPQTERPMDTRHFLREAGNEAAL